MSANNLRDWTVMVYFSADNDLQDEAFNNLSQMVEVGSSDKVHVLAQIHSRKGIPTRRYFMRGRNDAVSADVPGLTSSGSVDALLDFVRWAGEEHKAENYVIVLWGHANGIFDDEDDVGTAKIKAKLRTASKQRGEAPRPGESSKHSLNLDGAPDSALTSFELKDAFERIIEKDVLGQKVAILGMDACLMSMAEIARQVSGSVKIMVASEEVIPEKSWPYDRILRSLLNATKTRTVQPEELAKVIVDEYISRYEGDEEAVTLSACRLERMDNLAAALRDLGSSLTELLKYESLKKAVSRARRETQMFLFREYVDLFDFCQRLQKTLEDELVRAKGDTLDKCKKAQGAAQKMMKVIGSNGGSKSDFVLHCGSTSGTGGSLDRAHGVSIYFPPLPSTYADLELSERTHWNGFVLEYMKAVFRLDPLPEPAEQPRRTHPIRPEVGEVAVPGSETSNAKAPRDVTAATFDQPTENGEKARLWLPKGTRILDLNSGYHDILDNQAFLIMGISAEIRVPEGTELDMPKRGIVKASSGTSTKASTGTSTKASTGTSTKASTGTSTKASTGTSTKAIRRVDGKAVVEWLDVPACILNKAFSGGKNRKVLSSGTKIKPPEPRNDQRVEDVEPIIVIDDVKFVVVKSTDAFRNDKSFEAYLRSLLDGGKTARAKAGGVASGGADW